MERENLIQNSIISDMSEGVMAVRFDGVIEIANDAVLEILEKTKEELVGNSFVRAFFSGEENDAFIQSVLDAVYEKGRRLESYVPYRTETREKQLRIVSSCLREQEDLIGVILVISDITELTEMRDAVRAMEKIQELNRQLEIRNRVLKETFGRYLSDDVVQEILSSPGGWQLGGQRKTLSIMMSDLRGFTAMSERMDPQDLITMLNHYFREMYEEIEKYHGTLIEFLGDGMLVIFGAPLPNEAHAADAVAAALGMQRRMEAVNRWNTEQGYEPLAMGIGINTDAVILGNIGSEKRTKYGVLGAAVNLAGRIESYTTEGQILISPSTRDATDCELELARVFPVQPKGVDKSIELSDVIGLGGPYDLHLQRADAGLRTLPWSAVLRFSVLEGKHSTDTLFEGRIPALSESEAILETGAELALYDNVKLQIGGDLYAKVTEIGDGRYRVRFTAKPPCFPAWMEAFGDAEAITMDAALSNLEKALAFVDGYLERMGCPMKPQRQVDLAVEEAFANVANYAYGSGTGPVTLGVLAGKETGTFCVTLCDRGTPFNPLAPSDPDGIPSAPDRETDGLGILMMKTSMDSLRYEYRDGQNLLTMQKQITV